MFNLDPLGKNWVGFNILIIIDRAVMNILCTDISVE